MRKLFVLAGMALIAALTMASPAAASSTKCGDPTAQPLGETLTGATIPDDLVVPENGSCTIVNSTVGDDVRVGKNAYFEASNSQIGDDVTANRSLSVFLHDGTTVGDDIDTTNTPKVFFFDGTIGGHLHVSGSEQTVDICGNTVDGRIQVRNSNGDILVGDPAPDVGCAGNTVLDDHRIRVENNSVDVELVVNGNRVGGDLEVNDNSGPAAKLVQNNRGGASLECRGNETPFTASGNSGFDRKTGQCAETPETCNDPVNTLTRDFPGDVVVPENGVCILRGGTIAGDVKVGRNGYFQAGVDGTGTKIAGDVDGERALTVFIDTNSSVGGSLEASRTFQVFVFGATLNDEVEVSRGVQKVQFCGNTIDGDVGVEHSGQDILFGDPGPCNPNTVKNGHSATFEDNSTDMEFTIRGNTFEGGDLTVGDNHGPSDKFVQNNTGGDVLECHGNTPSGMGVPFTGTPNGFTTELGQCAEI